MTAAESKKLLNGLTVKELRSIGTKYLAKHRIDQLSRMRKSDIIDAILDRMEFQKTSQRRRSLVSKGARFVGSFHQSGSGKATDAIREAQQEAISIADLDEFPGRTAYLDKVKRKQREATKKLRTLTDKDAKQKLVDETILALQNFSQQQIGDQYSDAEEVDAQSDVSEESEAAESPYSGSGRFKDMIKAAQNAAKNQQTPEDLLDQEAQQERLKQQQKYAVRNLKQFQGNPEKKAEWVQNQVEAIGRLAEEYEEEISDDEPEQGLEDLEPQFFVQGTEADFPQMGTNEDPTMQAQIVEGSAPVDGDEPQEYRDALEGEEGSGRYRGGVEPDLSDDPLIATGDLIPISMEFNPAIGPKSVRAVEDLADFEELIRRAQDARTNFSVADTIETPTFGPESFLRAKQQLKNEYKDILSDIRNLSDRLLRKKKQLNAAERDRQNAALMDLIASTPPDLVEAAKALASSSSFRAKDLRSRERSKALRKVEKSLLDSILKPKKSRR